ncbi:MAG: HAMP domain-containing protein [Planctomycetes bacterium]|nr:HAMP domain-containing protein [Planctomycetota bacterium]NBY01408.1 HAMP domain-containing protein [Planctomycetota bacterium]
MFQKVFLPFVLVFMGILIILGIFLGQTDLETNKIVKIIITLSLIAVSLIAFESNRIAKIIAAPLEELSMGIQRVGLGDDKQRILSDEQGTLGNLMRSFNRMTERLEDKVSRLEEDRQQLRTILSGMVEGVVALDANQRVLFVNDRALILLDLQAHALEGKRLWELVRNREMMDLVEEALKQPEPKRKELTFATSGNRSLTLHAARLPGTPTRGAVLVLHDTTELRRLERLRQEFVANVSHELKTPLAVIKVCTETLLDGAVEDCENRMRFLEQILEQSERLNNLIMDLLSIARIEAETELFHFIWVPVREVIEQCVKRHKDRALQRSISINAIPMEGSLHPDNDLECFVDEEAFVQILDNLVDNAVKYSQDQGVINVQWGLENKSVIIMVSDNGIGIPEADLPRIFERFYRVDKARSREVGGTGLGLSIVKHLVQAMKGSISANSQMGKGTTFTVRLPYSKD